MLVSKKEESNMKPIDKTGKTGLAREKKEILKQHQ